jgi:hypothetical protein
MPLPILPLIAGALFGKAATKEEKRIPVNGRLKKDGTRSKATTRKAPKKRSKKLW